MHINVSPDEIRNHGMAKTLVIVTVAQRSRCPQPFAHDDENASYAHLAERCAERGVDLYVTHCHHLVGMESTFAWTWQEGAWQPVDLLLADVVLCYADLPENDSHSHAFRQALEAHPVTVVNAFRLSDLLTDRLATHAFFEGSVPPTWNAATTDLADHISRHPLHPDVSTDTLFLKPRFGERGRGIHVTDLEGLVVAPSLQQRDSILQAFLETEGGVPVLGIQGRHDLRLILRDGDIVLAYVRQPKADACVSNGSRGGEERPLEVEQLPRRLREFAAEVDGHLRCFAPRLYSLDVGFGRSGKIWIYGLNTMPSIVWDEVRPENKELYLEMHRILADWLASSVSKVEPCPEALHESACA